MIEHPSKIFPCECMGEGLIVVHQDEEYDQCNDAPHIEIGFWQFGHGSDKLTWREVFRTCWHIIRKRTMWQDMILLNTKVAKNFAHHILYLIDKEKKNRELPKPLVEEDEWYRFQKLKQ